MSEHCWKLVSQEAKDQNGFGDLERLFLQPNSSFVYRQHFARLSAGAAPLVPYLIPHMQTIALYGNALPSFFQDGSVNFSKMTVLSRLVSEIRTLRMRTFPFLVVGQVQAFVTTERLEKEAPSQSELRTLALELGKQM